MPVLLVYRSDGSTSVGAGARLLGNSLLDCGHCEVTKVDSAKCLARKLVAHSVFCCTNLHVHSLRKPNASSPTIHPDPLRHPPTPWPPRLLPLQQRPRLLPHLHPPLIWHSQSIFITPLPPLILHLVLIRHLRLLLIPRRITLRLRGPHERPVQLHRHPLRRARTVPALVLRTHGVGGLALPDAGLLDVGADAGADCEVVGVVEVVAEVKLIEPEGDEEGGAGSGLGGGVFEDYGEVGSGWRLLGLLL